MKIAIYGAGAVGSLFGNELARVGHDVTLIGRGAHIAAVRDRGLTVIMNGETRATRPRAVTDPAQAGPQDLVVMVVKGHQVPAAAARIAPLLAPDTPVVAAQNGIPWWYFHKVGGTYEGRTLNAIDPGGVAWHAIGPDRVIGGVIDAACAIVEPGVVDHHQKHRSLVIGEPDGSLSPRLARIAEAFAATDVEVPQSATIRQAIWNKLLSNVGVSMLCVLTRGTVGQVNFDPGAFAVAAKLMREMQAVAASVGVDIAKSVESRISNPPPSAVHKPSTLQDLERGRPMEIDPICGAVAEIARLTGTPAPWIDAIYALVRLLAETQGCYPPNPAFKLAPV
jgi:2-dehydropantoate 2-reductase